MIKYTLLVAGSLCIGNIAAHADPLVPHHSAADHQEEVGLGIGALIGGLVAGPPGAIIGAAGGAWLGKREEQDAVKLSTLEQRLLEKRAELAAVQDEFRALRDRQARQLQQVSLQKPHGALQDLSAGIALTVFFRTNSTLIEPEFLPDLDRLAHLVRDVPGIQVELEAHADRRGRQQHNQRLSEQRARAVGQKLLAAGLDASRIRSQALGEAQARAATGDEEGYVFDRRVTIRLSLDTET